MSSHTFATLFLLVMSLILFWGAWLVWKHKGSEKTPSTLGWQAEATALTLLGLQWLYFAYYIGYREPERTYLIDDVALPAFFLLPIMALIVYGVVWRITGYIKRQDNDTARRNSPLDDGDGGGIG